MTGIRAELVLDGGNGCPVADISAAVDGSVTDITWAGGEQTTEQVTVDGDTAGVDLEAAASTGDNEIPAFDRVFDYGSQAVYEFERDQPDPCVCEFIERRVGPVADARAVDGDLRVTLHTDAVDAMRDLVADLESTFGNVHIEYLVRSHADGDESDLIPVDLRRLTDRQREVLRRAHELGYFEYPREANASEVADSLGIGPSTFIEHLNAAQSKLLADLLGRR